jgi:hypothetical protein
MKYRHMFLSVPKQNMTANPSLSPQASANILLPERLFHTSDIIQHFETQSIHPGYIISCVKTLIYIKQGFKFNHMFA